MNEPRKYRQRTDYLWQSVTFYALIFLIYAAFRGTVSDWTFTVVLKDPFVVLLGLIMTGAGLSTLSKRIFRRSIIFNPNSVVLHTRFGEKEIPFDNIISITRKTSFLNKRKNLLPTFILEIEGRTSPIHIRPNAYKDSEELSDEIYRISELIQKYRENEKTH